jgi:hypothetical protein
MRVSKLFYRRAFFFFGYAGIVLALYAITWFLFPAP